MAAIGQGNCTTTYSNRRYSGWETTATNYVTSSNEWRSGPRRHETVTELIESFDWKALAAEQKKYKAWQRQRDLDNRIVPQEMKPSKQAARRAESFPRSRSLIGRRWDRSPKQTTHSLKEV